MSITSSNIYELFHIITRQNMKANESRFHLQEPFDDILHSFVYFQGAGEPLFEKSL